MSIRRAPDTRPARGGSTGRSHLGVGRLLGLLVPVLDRLELLRVALRLEAQLLDDRDEAVALVGRGRADPAADDVVDAHARRVAAARDPLALVARGGPREVANRLGHHAAERRQHALGAVLPGEAHPIASIPVAKRPMMSFWICVVPS